MSGLAEMSDDDDDDDDKPFAMLDSHHAAIDCPDVFYDSDLFMSADLDDTDLFSDLGVSADLDLWSNSEPPLTKPNIDLLADCEPLMHDGNGGVNTLELLCQAGIQQPAERQIRLHSELAHHLSTSPTQESMFAKSDSMLLKAETSSESELVRMLTSSLEDKSSVTTRLLPRRRDLQQQQRVPMVTVTNGDMLADSELVRQLNLCTDDVHVPVVASSVTSNSPGQACQQNHQRVALVQPTMARHVQTASLNDASQQLIINHPPPQTFTAQPTTLSVHGIQQLIEQQQPEIGARTTQVAPRQIVLTTQAPVQTHSLETTQVAPRQIVLSTGTQATVQSQEDSGGHAGPRQIVITTQAPVQTQHVPQISLQQLQQVHTQYLVLYSD